MTEDEMHKFFRDQNHARITGESSGSWGGIVGAAQYRERQQKEIAQRKKERETERAYARARDAEGSSSFSSSSSHSLGHVGSGEWEFGLPRIGLAGSAFVYVVYANYVSWPIEVSTYLAAAVCAAVVYRFAKLIFVGIACFLSLAAAGFLLQFLGYA